MNTIPSNSEACGGSQCRVVIMASAMVFMTSVMILMTSVVITGCKVGEDPVLGSANQAPAPKTALTVDVIRVERVENALQTIVCFGKLRARRQSRLSFGRGGRVKTVYKQLGDRVGEGDKLAEVEQSQLENQKLTIEQTLDRAKQRLQASSPAGPTSTSLKQQLQQLQTQLQEVELELANGVIVAPYDCVVAERNIDAGTLVSPAMPALQVVEDAQPLVEASLPWATASQLNSDQYVLVDIGDRAVFAKLQARSPLQDAAAGQRVLLEFNDELKEGSWSYGQVVEVRFATRTGDSGFWLPISALQRETDGLWSAFVAVQDADAEDDEFQVERRILEIVQLGDDVVLVQGSLRDSDLLIVDGTHRIVPGQKVKTMDVSSQFEAPFRPGAAE